jgi:hypothetical protein
MTVDDGGAIPHNLASFAAPGISRQGWRGLRQEREEAEVEVEWVGKALDARQKKLHNLISLLLTNTTIR